MIQKKETAGILLNHLSDHQITFTYIEKLSYIENVPKFISFEKNNAALIQNVISEMKTLNIYDELNKSIDSNPEEHYEVFVKSMKDVKNKCLPKKVVKYNKKKHKTCKRMTSALWKSINTKNQLYKDWIKTDINNVDLYSRRKEEFKSYYMYNTLRRSIREAKRWYYTRTFAIYKNNIKQTWTIIKDTLQRKIKCETPSQFVIGNRTVTNPGEIANKFNKYFVNIGRFLSEQINSQHNSKDYLGDKSKFCLNLLL